MCVFFLSSITHFHCLHARYVLVICRLKVLNRPTIVSANTWRKIPRASCTLCLCLRWRVHNCEPIFCSIVMLKLHYGPLRVHTCRMKFIACVFVTDTETYAFVEGYLPNNRCNYKIELRCEIKSTLAHFSEQSLAFRVYILSVWRANHVSGPNPRPCHTTNTNVTSHSIKYYCIKIRTNALSNATALTTHKQIKF